MSMSSPIPPESRATGANDLRCCYGKPRGVDRTRPSQPHLGESRVDLAHGTMTCQLTASALAMHLQRANLISLLCFSAQPLFAITGDIPICNATPQANMLRQQLTRLLGCRPFQ